MAPTDAPADTTANAPILVTADNFNRAETDKYFGRSSSMGDLYVRDYNGQQSRW